MRTIRVRTHPSSRSLLVLFAVSLLVLLLPSGVRAASLGFDANTGEGAVADGTGPAITGPFTVEAWVRLDASADLLATQFIVSKNLSGTGFALLASGTGPAKRFRFEANLVTGTAAVGASQPVLGRWTHVAGVWGDGAARLYVDGVLDGEEVVVDPPIESSEPVRIGSSPFGEIHNWRGDLGEVRLWTRALTASEIRRSMWSSFDTGMVGKDHTLAASWTFPEGAGESSADRTGNGHDLTLTGTTWEAQVPLEVPGLAAVVAGVGGIVSPGTPGGVMAYAGRWEGLAAGDEHTPLLSTFAMASRFGGGRVAVMGHDALVIDVDHLDNPAFLGQLMTWLAGHGGASVAYTTGHDEWLNEFNADGLEVALTGAGHTLTALTAPLTAGQLGGHDVLLVGNAWGTISDAEIDLIEDWTAAGGGVLLVGLGWSWPDAYDTYPSGRIADRFGALWLRNVLDDPVHQLDGSTVFHVFHPLAPGTSLPAAAQELRQTFVGHAADLPVVLASDAVALARLLRTSLILAQVPLIFEAGSPRLAEVAALHAEVAGGPGGSLLARGVTYGLEHEELAWLRERFFMTWAGCLPAAPHGPGSPFETLALLAAFPEAYEHLLLDHGVLILDNSALSSDQLRVIGDLLDLVPSNLHDLAYLSVRDAVGIDPPGGTLDFELFEAPRRRINILPTPVGEVPENSFPDEVPEWLVDQYFIIAAHEINHVVDAVTVDGTPALAARRDALITAAGADSLNYLRSFFPPDFFLLFPQEFVASIANQWFADSERVFELGAVRFDAGRPEPLNQALFFADLYVDGSAVWFYRSDTAALLERTAVPLARDAAGHISRLEGERWTWTFERDPATGNILSYQQVDAALIFADGFESGGTSSWSRVVDP